MTKVYVGDDYSAKLSVKLNQSYSIKKNSALDIVSKIESLLTLT
jgi:hypothetical protein